MKYLHLLLTFLLCFLFFSGFSQASLSKMKARISLDATKIIGVKMDVTSETQANVLFSPESSLQDYQSRQWLSTQLGLRLGVDMLSEDGLINTGDLKIQKLHQYYKGIKVEHGVINTTSSNGKVGMIQMEYYNIDDKFKTSPALSENSALQRAIEFVGAKVYAWDHYTGTDSEYMEPKGELVIVSTYQQAGEVCLAYKFQIYSLQPFSKAWVYVNAWDGNIVLHDPIIKHADPSPSPSGENTGVGNEIEKNAGIAGGRLVRKGTGAIATISKNNNIISNYSGVASTRFVGQQFITTDDNSGDPTKPYRLREKRNSQDIITLNYFGNPINSGVNNDAIAGDYTDNDNNWTQAEHHNDSFDDAALDVHFNMELVSDYWLNVQHRKGWDNKNGEIRSYVGVSEQWTYSNGTVFNKFYPNAYWNGKSMHFGNGTGSLSNSQPYTTLDISAHEMGHAITETTCGLVYQWESGAINEGFSDIWAACVTNYAKTQNPSLSSELTWRLAEKCEHLDSTNKGFRDMSNPRLFSNPSAYKDNFWTPAEYRTCKTFEGSDNCGVHNNSGVLNKWFFLITDGETGTNSLGKFYTVFGLGFAVAEQIAYLTSINLTPNASYATTKTVSINAAITLYGDGSVQVKSVKDAWAAVGVETNVFNMSNTGVFTSNNFTGIAVDGNGDVWAGTTYNGLYRYKDSTWEKRSEVSNVRINDIKTDKSGNIWIAQSGTQAGGSQALAGGVNYLRAPFGAADNSFYTVSTQTNIPSRNVRCIFIDTSRKTDGTNPAVWIATNAYITSGNSASGMLGQGLYNTSRYFHAVSEGLNIASNTSNVNTVGGNSSEIWTFAQANNGINQLLTYDAGTNALIKAYDHNSTPIIPSSFVARSIFGDSKKRIWIGLANNGLLVFDEKRIWHSINFPEAFPAGIGASFNAICGDRAGDVYIGTDKGIVFFDKGDGLPNSIDNPTNYRLFSTANGLPSNKINALTYDTSRFKLMVATDTGVVFFEPFCLSPDCKEFKSNADVVSESLKSGNWSDPSLWSGNKIPDSLTVVTITHNVTVDINARCKQLTALPGSSVTVSPGINLTLYPEKPPIQTTLDQQKSMIKPND